MRVMVMVKATKESEAGVMPSEELLTAMGNFNEELVKAGIMLAGEGLHPSSKGHRVRFEGRNRTVIDGPFAETKELVAGFWIWQVKSMEEAIEWVKRCPNPMMSDSEIEVRRIFAAEDFGEEFTPELRQQEEELQRQIERYKLEPRIENSREILISGLNEHYDMQTRSRIPAQWERVVAHMGKIPGQQGNVTYGASWNNKPNMEFDYLTGVEVKAGSKQENGFTQLKLPAGKYAVFTHHGPIYKIAETFDAIFNKWLPNSGHQPAGAPCYERYTEDFDPQTSKGLEIWLPIKG